MSAAQTHTMSERTDDIPVIVHLLLELKVAEILDKALPQPHGNRQGLSYGQLAVVFLSYIMSQADHRLCAVEEWVNQHKQTLERATGWTIGVKDASDDRLGALVEVSGTQVEAREQCEQELGQEMIMGLKQ